MAGLLSRWAEAFERSEFYTEFCVYLPEGLNNAYLDVLILLAGAVILLLALVGNLSAKRRQRMFERELLMLKAEGRKDGKRSGGDLRTSAGPVKREGVSAGKQGSVREKAEKEPRNSDHHVREASGAGGNNGDPGSGQGKRASGAVKKGSGNGRESDRNGREKSGNGRKRFDVEELIARKREEEAERNGCDRRDGYNKLEASIGLVKAERDMEARLREMDEASKERARRNLELLSRQFEKSLRTDPGDSEWRFMQERE
ncbi:MAG TPA: hypothetical protein DCL38_07625 [Lachnospiraceae bacterium]|nr:hypothetical protein [Lachnospiraceae bacterium]